MLSRNKLQQSFKEIQQKQEGEGSAHTFRLKDYLQNTDLKTQTNEFLSARQQVELTLAGMDKHVYSFNPQTKSKEIALYEEKLLAPLRVTEESD